MGTCWRWLPGVDALAVPDSPPIAPSIEHHKMASEEEVGHHVLGEIPWEPTEHLGEVEAKLSPLARWIHQEVGRRSNVVNAFHS